MAMKRLPDAILSSDVLFYRSDGKSACGFDDGARILEDVLYARTDLVRIDQ